MVKVFIEHDQDCENPCDCDGWKLYSFSRRHASFKHPDAFGVQRDGTSTDVGFRRKLKVGTAFVLGYMEHGMCRWALSHEENPYGQYMGFDSVSVAGVLVWEQPVSNLGPKTYEDRAQDARRFLEVYTDWCNGACYCYTIKDEEDTLESCGGFIGQESLRETVAEALDSLGIKDAKFAGEGKEIFS